MKLVRRAQREPLWREEFPIISADERYVNRRQFAKFLVLTSLGMFVGNVWILSGRSCAGSPSSAARRWGARREIPVGGVKLFRYPGPRRSLHPDPAAAPDDVRGLQPEVHPPLLRRLLRPERDRLECPCHEGYFSVHDGGSSRDRRRVRCRGSSSSGAGTSWSPPGGDPAPAAEPHPRRCPLREWTA